MKTIEIALEHLGFHSLIGVMAQEKVVGHDFVVDLAVRIPYSEGVERDDMDATISYADLYEVVRMEIEKPRDTIEAVAASIVNEITRRWPQIESGGISICKSTPPITGITGSAKVSIFF